MNSKPMTNMQFAKQILQELTNVGVRDFFVCAGARNSPLVVALEDLKRTSEISVLSFFEERSAAFFALGRARRDGRPTAVITTSGTAAVELLPAIVEAFYSGVPVIAVTADRPKRLRGTGAPQAIDQSGLMSKFVASEFDLELQPLQIVNWQMQAPLHVNVCFDEPLLDEASQAWELKISDPSSSRKFSRDSSASFAAAAAEIFARVEKDGPPIAIVGTIQSFDERAMVLNLLLKLQVPVYLESTSGLRGHSQLAEFELQGGDGILNWALKRRACRWFLRLGGVPTVRVWRDLDLPSCAADVLSVSTLPFSGLSRGTFRQVNVFNGENTLHLRAQSSEKSDAFSELYALDQSAFRKLLSSIQKYPLSEPAWVERISKWLRPDDEVYVGNSLPIREWDLCARRDQRTVVRANRGVNGIDGQISTWLGLSASDSARISWALLGDLTTMYDLAGLWPMGREPSSRNCKLVIINNHGGRIFKRIFARPLFENEHAIEFSGLAKLWKVEFSRLETANDANQFRATPKNEILEVVPDANQTSEFFADQDDFWKQKMSQLR